MNANPRCTICEEAHAPLFWNGARACRGCYTASMERWQKRVGYVLEAAERGLLPEWLVEKELGSIACETRAD